MSSSILAEIDPEGQCTICLGDTKENRRILTCGHSYCRVCIKNHYNVTRREGARCPICRRLITGVRIPDLDSYRPASPLLDASIVPREDPNVVDLLAVDFGSPPLSQSQSSDEPEIVGIVDPPERWWNLLPQRDPQEEWQQEAERVLPRRPSALRIVNHFGRGRNISYLVEWSDGVLSAEPANVARTYEDGRLSRDYHLEIRRHNQARYRIRLRDEQPGRD